MYCLVGVNLSNFDHFPRFQRMIFLSTREVNSSRRLTNLRLTHITELSQL